MNKWFLAFFILAGSSLGETQSCRIQEDYSTTAVSSYLSAGDMIPSYLERKIFSLGDQAAIAIVKTLQADELAKPEAARRVLKLIHNAFIEPSRIEVVSDRKPAVTVLLLRSMRDRTKDHKLKTEIDSTMSFIVRQTSK